MLARSRTLLALGFTFCLTAAPARAQDEEPEGAETEASDDSEPAEEKKSEAQSLEVVPPPETEASSGSPIEREGTTYRFVGLRYRGIIVPKFMMNLFGDGGRTVYVDSFGPEFTIRKDAFEYIFSIWFADYGMEETPFKSSSDAEDAWEIVSSEIKVIFLTADFLWTHEFSPEFGLNYGMGAGFGFVFGDLARVQATPPDGVAGDPYKYEKCVAPGNPNSSYCGSDNDHYGSYTEPSWADGGSKPIIFPWLALQTGFRYKPHKNFVARLDAGFGTSGFFVGLGANYGL
jgi:hypothetical protein